MPGQEEESSCWSKSIIDMIFFRIEASLHVNCRSVVH